MKKPTREKDAEREWLEIINRNHFGSTKEEAYKYVAARTEEAKKKLDPTLLPDSNEVAEALGLSTLSGNVKHCLQNLYNEGALGRIRTRTKAYKYYVI